MRRHRAHHLLAVALAAAAVLTGGVVPAGADQAYPPPGRAFDLQAHRDVVPWTVNDRPTMEALIDIGVDGPITDRPDRLQEVLAERGLRLPRAYRSPR